MPSTVVVKFGGTSISNLTHVGVIKRIEKDFPHKKVICVLSAESNVTNTLISEFEHQMAEYAKQLGIDPKTLNRDRLGLEYDLHVSYGETKSIWKGSIAGKLLKKKVLPLGAWQARIRSTANHEHATITDIDDRHLLNLLKHYDILFIAGFQGVSDEHNITTLGRGASDLSAVAIASALGLDSVYIYTDVDGIYTVDPRLLPNSVLIDELSYEEALELSTYGNKVIHERAVSLARKYCTDIIIRNSLCPTTRIQTRITSKFSLRSRSVKRAIVGMAARSKVVLCDVLVANKPGKAHEVFAQLMSANVSPSAVAQGLSGRDTATEIVFTAEGQSSRSALSLLNRLKSRRLIRSFKMEEELSEISIVGMALESMSGFLSELCNILRVAEIKPVILATTGIRVTIVLPASRFVDALTSLHSHYFNTTKR